MKTTKNLSRALYFHGLPGSADELSIVGIASEHRPHVLAPLDLPAFDDFVAANGKAKVIGFSLGAFSALKIAAERPDDVSELILISPAGPLELGDFLSTMAGAPVFQMAKTSSTGLTIMTAIQSALSFAAPKFLLKQMFAKSCVAEQTLLENDSFIEGLTAGLRSSLFHEVHAYKQVLKQYVQPWADDLKRVRCPSKVHHGELDNWSPITMSQAIVTALPTPATLSIEQGLGHYSTLIKVLPKILIPFDGIISGNPLEAPFPLP